MEGKFLIFWDSRFPEIMLNFHTFGQKFNKIYLVAMATHNLWQSCMKTMGYD